MKRGKQAIMVPLILILIALTTSGCGLIGANQMNSDVAREQLDSAVEAVQTVVGEHWEVEVAPVISSCSRTHGQWVGTWTATTAEDRASSYDSVMGALSDLGFTTRILGPNSTTPSVGAQSSDGFGAEVVILNDGETIRLNVGSDCFVE